ncbi:MAG: GNAT family N-acetyltransferase [Acidobacteria bacterium]|jgi:CelD/BcsL family acetyltransferase involved in cellulose biosynthesis|nr:GNAT family N-acetyltransferase [Acidobacteriota bacterium]
MLSVELLDLSGDPPGLREEWGDLLRRSRARTPFLTWEWMSLWWRHYGADLEPLILGCRDGEGRMVGVAPLAISRPRAGGVLPLRRVGFLGSNEVCSDYLDFVSEPDREVEVAERVFAALVEREASWDLLSLSSVPTASPTLSTLADLARGKGLPALSYEHSVCPYVSWSGGWDDFLRTRGKSVRRHLKQQMKRLSGEGPVRLTPVETAPDLARAFDRFVTQHQRRWGTRGGFSRETFIAFHRDVMRAFLEQGWLDLTELRVGEEVVAMRYGFRFDDRFFGYLPTFNLSWGRFGVGALALALCVERAVKDGRELNLLRGTSPHKLRWATGTRTNGGLEVGARHPRGRITWAAARMEERGRQALRALLPRRILRLLKSLAPEGLEDE